MIKLKTLKKDKEFKATFKGKSLADKNIVLYYIKNSDENFRVGFVVSKKVGKAVRRNKIKRLLKEGFRKNLAKFDNNFNLIIIPRQRLEEDLVSIEKSILRLTSKAGILKTEKVDK